LTVTLATDTRHRNASAVQQQATTKAHYKLEATA
jgi:hypothetical protein